MKIYLLVVGIIFLFIGMSFTSISGIQINNQIVNDSGRGNILIVDDEGDGDYTSIKDAVNNTNPGDTIEVFSGIYYESGIEIQTENITLKGIPYELGNGGDTGKPFINGEGKNDVIKIKSPRIAIDNFRIENLGGTGAHGIIGIRKDADNCVISHNDIRYTFMACIGCSSNNNSIIKNNISHSAIRQGIVLDGEYNIVTGNIISDVRIGIALWDSNYNKITGNKIMRCSSDGIDVGGSYNKIIGNHFERNDFGINMPMFYNSIERNNFINNEYDALVLIITNFVDGNYWDEWIGLKYPILSFLPHFSFGSIFASFIDWHPAKQPYNITTTQECV